MCRWRSLTYSSSRFRSMQVTDHTDAALACGVCTLESSSFLCKHLFLQLSTLWIIIQMIVEVIEWQVLHCFWVWVIPNVRKSQCFHKIVMSPINCMSWDFYHNNWGWARVSPTFDRLAEVHLTMYHVCASVICLPRWMQWACAQNTWLSWQRQPGSQLCNVGWNVICWSKACKTQPDKIAAGTRGKRNRCRVYRTWNGYMHGQEHHEKWQGWL